MSTSAVIQALVRATRPVWTPPGHFGALAIVAFIGLGPPAVITMSVWARELEMTATQTPGAPIPQVHTPALAMLVFWAMEQIVTVSQVPLHANFSFRASPSLLSLRCERM